MAVNKDIPNGKSYQNGGSSSAPQTVQFADTPQPPVNRTNTNRLDKSTRSVSTATLSGESSASVEHKPQGCDDENCAFGWQTYVLDHACDASTTKVQQPEPKVSIHKLLHQEEDNPLLRPFEEGTIRHVHLPANNMKWVEDLIRRYYHNKDGNKQLRLLRSDFWHGQQHGRSGPIHARFMRHRCDIVPAGLGELDATHRDFVISMPYLHWETDEARAKMHSVVKDIESHGHRTFSGVKPEDLPFGEKGKNLHKMALNMAAQNALKNADADELLLRTHLLSERPVHIRRTLDQSYYWTLKDTSERDRDQVVYRATEHQNPRVVMVDQLWMWILDGKLVITSFPRRWGRKKQDPSGVYKSIREKLGGQPDLDNVYDMATMMIDQCSRVFFDRAVSRDNRPEVVDIFSNAIGKLTDRSTNAYNNFWKLIRPDSQCYGQMQKKYSKMLKDDPKAIWKYAAELAHQKSQAASKEATLLGQLLDINPEGELLLEIKDIQDELHMMTKVYAQQLDVVEDFAAHIDELGTKLGARSSEVTQKTKDKVSHLVKEVKRRKAEIYELTRAAEKTAEGLKDLLDLKQRHANVEEARQANNILLATQDLAQQSALQTIQGNKQNRALMIFTIVTIIFLPLGFFSSVFGMNAPEFGQGGFHIWKQFLIMFPVSIVIIAFSLALALSEDFLGICGATLQLWWARFLQSVGLFEGWKKKGVRVRNAAESRREKLEALYGGKPLDNGTV